MNINLNKKIVTKEGILLYIKDIDVYRYYSGTDVIVTGGLHSPLRDDDNPSFGYFYKNNEILFNDFVLGGGDFVRFVMLKFGLTYFEALSKIVVDFNLTYHFNYKDINKTKKNYNPDTFKSRDKILSQANRFKLKKKSRKWKLHDYKYWRQFGIDADTLEKYNVEPISHIFLNDKIIKVDKFAYCFTEYKDNKETYKIYQPFNDLYKWINNHNDSVWQGWTQLPKQHDTLIITKSLKDVMSIDNVLNIPSVSLQAESVNPKKHIINELRNRFNFIVVLYDNDFNKTTNWGRILGEKLCKQYNFLQYEIPDRFESKDFSDLVKDYGVKDARNIFKSYIHLPF